MQEELIKKSTLVEHGDRLLIGVLDNNGVMSKDLSMRKWKMKQERKIGDLRVKHKNESMARHVAIVLSVLYDRIGSNDLEPMSDERRLTSISQMYMGDVLYAYMWLRRSVVGDELDLVPMCPVCKKTFEFKASLDTMSVKTVDNPEHAVWEYKLIEPIKVSGTVREALRFGMQKWYIPESIKGTGINMATASAEMIKGCMVDAAITDGEIDELCKADVDGIVRGLDDHYVGPDMTIEGACPHCSNEFRIALDWSYENFFAASSR